MEKFFWVWILSSDGVTDQPTFQIIQCSSSSEAGPKTSVVDPDSELLGLL
jgi:hypothetical protein